MRGFPKHFETKQDYLNSMELYPEETKKALRSLYADRYTWVVIKELKSRSEGIEDAFHIISECIEKGEIKIKQLEAQEDPNARYLRLGFTKEEITYLSK